jgi:DNA-binding CsgD family transcriptional regulator
VTLALDIGAAQPCIPQVGYAGVAPRKWVDSRDGGEREWLDLLARLFADLPIALPCEQIARMLCGTFRAQACCYLSLSENAVGGVVWSGEGVVGGPTTAGAAPPRLTFLHHLSLPAAPPSGTAVTFVLGREQAYNLAERGLAGTLTALIEALTAQIHAEAAAAPRRTEPVALTRREQAVLTLLGDGLTAVAIARRLQISSRTVQKHLERTYRKLDVTDRLSAVLMARQLGLLVR